MAQYDERALVLDVTQYRESSLLVRVLTEHEGRISLVARGIRKANAGSGAAALQPFHLVKLRFALKDGANMGNLISADLERAATAPHGSIEAYALVSYWFEILKVTSLERAAMGGVFDLTMRMLDGQRQQAGLNLHYLRNLMELWRRLGFGISWERCLICDRSVMELPSPLFFSISRGGVVCDDCQQKENLATMRLTDKEKEVVKFLEAASGSAGNFTTSDLLSILGVLNRFLVNHLEQPLRTFSFVNNVMGHH